jgi:hypothetical protein
MITLLSILWAALALAGCAAPQQQPFDSDMAQSSPLLGSPPPISVTPRAMGPAFAVANYHEFGWASGAANNNDPRSADYRS